jgi:hypothetical protein
MKSSVYKLFTILALACIGIGSFVAADVEEEEDKMTAVFVNQHPRDEIKLYWVNPQFDEDHPERLVSIFITYQK